MTDALKYQLLSIGLALTVPMTFTFCVGWAAGYWRGRNHRLELELPNCTTFTLQSKHVVLNQTFGENDSDH